MIIEKCYNCGIKFKVAEDVKTYRCPRCCQEYQIAELVEEDD